MAKKTVKKKTRPSVAELKKKTSVKKTKAKAGKKKVVIYSTPTCQWCAKTKEFFKANKVSFTNKDVSKSKKNADEMMKKSGQMGVPVTVVGDKVIVGYNESKLRKALGRY